MPPVINVVGAVPAEDGVGGRVERRLRMSDIDPDFAINAFSTSNPSAGTYERGQPAGGVEASAVASYLSGPPDAAEIGNANGGSSSGSDINLGAWTPSNVDFTNWTANGPVTRFGLDHGADPTLTITLTALQGSFNDTSSKVLTWTSRVFWGLGAIGGADTVNETFVEALSNSQVRPARGGTLTLTPNNQYVYFAIPTDYGTPNFVLNGFPFAATKIQSATTITNAYGVARQYDIWRSTNLLTSATALNIIVS